MGDLEKAKPLSFSPDRVAKKSESVLLLCFLLAVVLEEEIDESTPILGAGGQVHRVTLAEFVCRNHRAWLAPWKGCQLHLGKILEI